MAGGYNTGQATVATTATVIAAARPGRKTITIVNGGTTPAPDWVQNVGVIA